LSDLIAGQGYQGSPVIFQVKEQDTAKISSFLNSKEAKQYLPSEYSHVKFLLGISDKNKLVPLYGAKSNRENKAPLTGKLILKTTVGFDAYRDMPEINVELNKKAL